MSPWLLSLGPSFPAGGTTEYSKDIFFSLLTISLGIFQTNNTNDFDETINPD